jgi:hypothetical protein
MRTTRRSSRAGFWVAGLIAVAGLVGAVIWGLVGLSGMVGQVDAFPRMDVPGERVLTVQEPVELTIFYEAPGIDQEQAELPPLTLSIFDPDGAPVAVAGYGSELTYHVDDHTGRAVATFAAAAAGDYRMLVEGDAPPGATIAVGEDFGGFIGALLGAGLLVLVTLGAAIILALITANRRRKSTPSPSGSPTGAPPLPPPPPPPVRVPTTR